MLCDNKRKYTKKEAEEQLNYRLQEGAERTLRIYECPDCNWWHLTKAERYYEKKVNYAEYRQTAQKRTKSMHWQNLIHQKCPRCDGRLVREPRVFKCPDERCDFMITPAKMAEILTDPNHNAYRYMSDHEKKTLSTAMQSLGIVL